LILDGARGLGPRNVGGPLMDVSEKQRFWRRTAVVLGLLTYIAAWVVTLGRLSGDGSSVHFREGVFIQNYWVSDWGNLVFLVILGPVAVLAAYNYWRR
jgi:hypothetical protein